MNSEGNTTKSFGIKIKNVRLTVNAKEKVNGYLGTVLSKLLFAFIVIYS